VETSEPLPREERVGALVDLRPGLCKDLPPYHWFYPKFARPLQVIDLSEIDQAASNNPKATTSSSQPQPTTQSSDPSLLEELANHYKAELPGFEPNLEKASEMASYEVVLEDPQQQKPNSQMASSTCSDLIIHPDFQPYYLNATHSNISFEIALRNLAHKNSSTHLSPASDKNPSLSEETTLVVQPLSVALPSEITLETEPEHENSTGPDFMITSISDDENEQTNQWFRPRFLNQPLSSSSTCVLESIHDPPLISSQIFVYEHTITDLPCSANQVCPLTITTNVSPTPIILLDSTILQEVCENIFKDLNKLVKTKSNLIHKESCVDQ